MTNVTVAHIRDFSEEPRVRDVALASQLGFSRARGVRDLIARNRSELELYGDLPRVAAPATDMPGRPGTEFWLNEAQALLLCMFSRAPMATRARHCVIQAFVDWRAGKRVAVRAHARRIPAAPRGEYEFCLRQYAPGEAFTVIAVVPLAIAMRMQDVFQESIIY